MNSKTAPLYIVTQFLNGDAPVTEDGLTVECLAPDVYTVGVYGPFDRATLARAIADGTVEGLIEASLDA